MPVWSLGQSRRRSGVWARTVCLLIVGTGVSVGPAAGAQPSTVGQWSSVQTWPYRAIHAQMLPTGRVMFWDSYAKADRPHLWDPGTGSISAAVQAGYNIFCTGFSFLPDGRLFVIGGHIADNVGLSYTSTYDPFTNSWSRLPSMNAGRWYPTATALANGDILALSGMVNTSVGANLLPQVWQAASGTWRDLTSAQLSMPYYPYMFLAPNGQVFNAGPSQTTRYLNTSGTGAWTLVGNNTYGTRNWGSAVMYDNGRVLIMGGTKGPFYYGGSAAAPTNSAEAIDLTAGLPVWKPVAPMTLARKHHNATLLPDGRVLVTGGSSGSEDTLGASATPALAAEMWDPATNIWARLASNKVYRGYHASALLLPDGRVLSAGGNFEATAEVYSPPYLFKGARPAVTSAPGSVGYGQTFFVGTPDTESITRVSWIGLSAVTHTNNMGQRINRLGFSRTTGGLNVTAPSNSNFCQPGYYMLFLLNGNGVPSVARMVRIVGTTSSAPAAAPGNLRATAVSSSRINLMWTDNSSNETGFKIERCVGKGSDCDFGQIAQVGPGVTAYSDANLSHSTTYRYRVRAYSLLTHSSYSNTASAKTYEGP